MEQKFADRLHIILPTNLNGPHLTDGVSSAVAYPTGRPQMKTVTRRIAM